MSFQVSYPYLYLFICCLLAASSAWFLYRKNPLDISNKYILWLIHGLRFASIFILCFLLLGPLLNLVNRKVEKPIIMLAVDNSQSIVSSKDSAFYRNEFSKQILEFKDKISNKYEVKFYTLGKDVNEDTKIDFSQKQSDLSKVFSEAENKFSNLNLGAIILASDGIYNEGENPIYTSKNTKAPVFTIALGDTNQQKDALISNVRHNQLVFAGNNFEMQIECKTFNCLNQNSKLKINHNGKTIFEQNLQINSQSYFNNIPVKLEANEEGTQHYSIQISPLSNEISYANNVYDVFINVIKSKQKVLILAQAPHPDVSAMKQSIESNLNYEVSYSLLENFNYDEKSRYDLVILHQLPGARNEGLRLIKSLREKQIPLLFVLGNATGVNQISNESGELIITGNRTNSNDVNAIFNKQFALFGLDESNANIIQKFPPLSAPYGNYKVPLDAQVLFYQQIGYVKTQVPLVFFIKSNRQQTGYFCGEGFWKWRLQNYLLQQNHDITNELMSKIVQLLASKNDNSLFRVSSIKKKFFENEKIELDAELYNESYELINQPDVSLEVKDSKGKLFQYTFSKTEKSYHANLGNMPVGTYTYNAKVTSGNKTYYKNGQFIVAALQAELIETKANHQLLSNIALQSGGQLFYKNQLDALEKAIEQNENIKPVIYKQNEVKELLNLKWIFFVILGLLSLEWFIRKWNGFI
jgi:hypothetical protein